LPSAATTRRSTALIDTTTDVVVLRADHYSALGVMRSLGRLGVRVYAVHRDPHASALASRYCAGHLTWDLDSQPADASIDFLLAVAATRGGRPILVPTNDETALFVARNADRLRRAFRFQDNPATLVESLYDKKAMCLLAQKLGIPTPQTLFPTCRDEVVEHARTARFPLMLKGSDGIRLSHRTGLKMVIVKSPAELLAHYDRMEDAGRPDLMLQEYIPGGEDAQWMWNGYLDPQAGCRFGITGRKLRQTPVYTGMTSLGVCLPNEDVAAWTEKLAAAVGYRGILDIGYRYDRRDGRYKLLDVNPRLGATFRLFVGGDGMDVVRALYLDLTGQAIPASAPRYGRKWFVEDLDLESSVRYHRDGVLGVGDWLRSFRGVEESAWFAVDDVRPLLAMLAATGSRVVRKAVRSGRGALADLPDFAGEPREHVERVVRHFTWAARYWKDIYEQEQLSSRIYHDRQAAALNWVDQLRSPPRARALDVGCGAGGAALALAGRGFQVQAVDATPEMVELTRKAAQEAGLRNLSVSLADVHRLDLPTASFDVIVALGLLPWLHSDARAVAEMARVLKPRGRLILSADNDRWLGRLVDPRATPMLEPLRAFLKRRLQRPPAGDGIARRHEAAQVDALLRGAGLQVVERTTVGFGPLSAFGLHVIPERSGIWLHGVLQGLAQRGWPGLRLRGSQYLVMATKPARDQRARRPRGARSDTALSA
jgi:predicted ATP-grasp superfamily ATP-dependent carboligase/ubiquinone/menaquinone biosynthesis C-methylase UbiE